MDIYKHKKEGLVVFWGNCTMRTSVGSWVKGTMYKKLILTDSKHLDDKGHGRGKADIHDEIFTVPTSFWKKHVKRYGTVSSVEGKAEGIVKPPLTEEETMKRENKDQEIAEAAASPHGTPAVDTCPRCGSTGGMRRSSKGLHCVMDGCDWTQEQMSQSYSSEDSANEETALQEPENEANEGVDEHE